MIVLSSLLLALTVVKAAQVPAAWNGASRFHQDGTSLVSAMQLAVTDNDELVIFGSFRSSNKSHVASDGPPSVCRPHRRQSRPNQWCASLGREAQNFHWSFRTHGFAGARTIVVVIARRWLILKALTVQHILCRVKRPFRAPSLNIPDFLPVAAVVSSATGLS